MDETGNIDGVPLFANTGDGDLSILFGSDSINSGNNDVLPQDEADIDGDKNVDEDIPWDFNNEDRVAETTVDMGAYEYQP